MYKNRIATVPIIALVSVSIGVETVLIRRAQCENSVKVENTVEEGLNTTVFDTPEGKISVNLPDDMAAGDTLSGTVLTEAIGATAEEKEENSNQLNGYVVEVKKAQEVLDEKPQTAVALPEEPQKEREEEKPKQKKTPRITPSKGYKPFAMVLPQMGEPIEICLSKPDGPPICKKEYKVPKSPPLIVTTETVTWPQVGMGGKPIPIKTRCDGKFSNSKVNVGNRTCRLLAESPRQIVARSPVSVVGPTTITINEGSRRAKGHFTNLQVKLTAPKVVLKQGESTTMTVIVTGLEGVTSPVRLKLENKTPDNVSLSGGNSQEIIIQPRRSQSKPQSPPPQERMEQEGEMEVVR